jgi:type II secretory pathway pseudopilin PulG
MVVIVVLMILTAMILPQFGGTYQDALLRSHGRQILEALNLAYSQAVTTGKRVRLRLDPGRGRFWLEERGEEGDGGFHPVAGLPGGAGELDPRISLEVRAPREGMSRAAEDRPERDRDQGESGEIQSVTFRPDGTAQAREILLRDRDGFSMALRIEANTARARLVEVERAQP